MMMFLTAPLALATAGFDPTTPAAVFGGEETYTQDGSIRLWAEIARYEDPDDALFTPANFSETTAWPAESVYAPWIAACFGTPEPPTSSFLLHVGPSLAFARGTPVLFVPGAADNGSRGFVAMALHFDTAGRPAFAVTFAHPHGDVHQQAEIVADAIAAVRARTGAAQVDVVSHSKGGIATAVYLSDLAQTGYRGDVRRAVFVATPLGGIDTTFRWPAGNYASIDTEAAFSPASWSTYYPSTSSVYWDAVDLSDQDFLPDGADLFPGHRQLLARQDYPLPGSLPWLGAYALQQDWYSTYEGGVGYYSDSSGIDAAIEAGGNVIATLHEAGVDPSVELFLLAGENPLLPNGSEVYAAELFGQEWVDTATEGINAWADFVAELVGNSMLSVGLVEGEVQGLASGDLILGEISGPSDGLVFISSATDASALTARGAVVAETKIVNLSHLDLLYASPITGGIIIDDAGDDPDKAWQAAVGARYVAADTIGWVDRVLSDEPVDPPDDGPDDPGITNADEWTEGGCGCDGTGAGVGLLLPLWLVGRIRRRVKGS